MKADPADQLRLLELQELDSRLTSLARRRAALPELAELAALATELAGLADSAVVARTRVQDLSRAQTKLETDVDVVRQRMARDQTRLDSGQVSASKELVDLQSEIESLHRRQTVLEDEELSTMVSSVKKGWAMSTVMLELTEVGTPFAVSGTSVLSLSLSLTTVQLPSPL